jgi:hypothetical protein
LDGAGGRAVVGDGGAGGGVVGAASAGTGNTDAIATNAAQARDGPRRFNVSPSCWLVNNRIEAAAAASQ